MLFPQYTADMISGAMSLREPQEESLKILEEITDAVPLRKGMNLKAALGAINAMYPTCKDFEREFPSLTFALATGVGKTRLMGAFIAYLYTQRNIRNFFVVAPGTTVYEKLKRDLSDPSNPKYVFQGLGCFSSPPQVISEEEYRDKDIDITLYLSDIRIFVYNIDKFNKEGANMRRANEMLGESFYQYLSSLPDLVMIMDESHHYRAEQGAKALNELRPLLGLELTATPLVSKGTKQIPFKNVVYEYPLSKAIEDGYTRTPYALTRSDINFYNFGDEQLDKLMLTDGIACHERTKSRLAAYAKNHGKKVIKPFTLVVCKDTEHAKRIETYVKSKEFRDGAYRNKTLVVHSKQGRAESEANTRLLLEVENPENPVEIVIHVNMLKEGWDVNNLYTIIPLRTAASKILREQMVGRGLRLPYGKRTGDKDVDAVTLTAHDKFDDILREAQKGTSIFKAGNVIHAEDIEPEQPEEPQLSFNLEVDQTLKEAYAETGLEQNAQTDKLIHKAAEEIVKKVSREIQRNPKHTVTEERAREIASETGAALSQDEDLGTVFRDNEMPLTAWLRHKTEQVHREAAAKFIPVPQIRVTDNGVEEYIFQDFDLELAEFTHRPIRNEILIQNLEDPRDRARIRGDAIDFEGYQPKRVILAELTRKPEIDYEKCSALLIKLISQICDYYQDTHGENGMRNIVMMFRREIAEKIYNQMMRHFYCTNGFLREEVIGTRNYNIQPTYSAKTRHNLYDNYSGDIRSIIFDGIRKGVFDRAKFDSEPELQLARNMETDNDVLNWLRPAPNELNITYNHGHRYEPLTEVKRDDQMENPDVVAKKERGIQYCAAASRWGKANGYKEWRYLLIPASQIQRNSSFAYLILHTVDI